jgi:hypothetical protein
MSIYYKYQFVSPEGVYSTVKEELKSYFDTGAIDDLLFPVYLNKCLNKLGKTTYSIAEIPLEIENYQARLPDNFYGAKEAWATAEVRQWDYRDANAFYSQAGTLDTIQVSPITTDCPQENPCCGNMGCDGKCMPEYMQTVYKTTGSTPRGYRRTYLLTPGNINASKQCVTGYTGNLEEFGQTGQGYRYPNFVPFSSTVNSFDIRDNKFVTNFRSGIVHLVFYSADYDQVGNQMMPDNYRIKEYVEAFIKYKVMETLTNQINDETFNQMQSKMIYYKGLADEAYIMADIETKKQDPWTKQRRIKNTLNRNQMYELPIGLTGMRRRNG